jgi:ABC-2 type transport system permease protein
MVNSLFLTKANILNAKKYKIDWYGQFLTPLLTILPVAFMLCFGTKSGMIGFFSKEKSFIEMMGFIILGAAYWNYVEVLWNVIFHLRYLMKVGQLEEIFIMPISSFGYIFSWSVMGFLKVTVESIPILILSIIFSITDFTIYNFLMSILVLIISIIASFGFVFLFFGLTLKLKDGDELVSLLGNASPLIGGMFFSVTILPFGLRIISYIFPFTWGLDLVRHFLIGTETILDIKNQFIVLIALTLFYLFLGIVSFVVLEKKSRKNGLQGF